MSSNIDEVVDKLHVFSKTELFAIMVISIISGLAGYLNDLVKEEQTFKKLNMISTILNSILAGAIVGSLLSMVPLLKDYPMAIFGLISLSTYRATKMMEHLTKAMVDLVPSLFARIKMAMHLMISPDGAYHMYKENEIKTTPTTPTTPTNSAPPPTIEPQKEVAQPPVVETVKPVEKVVNSSKIDEARKKLGLPPKA